MHDPRRKEPPALIAHLQQNLTMEDTMFKRMLLQVLDGLRVNQWHIYTLFTGTPEEEKKGSGGGQAITSLPSRMIGEIVAQADRMAIPAQRWTNTVGAVAQRNFLAVFDPVVVDHILGVVHIESMRDQSQIRKHVWLRRTSGTGSVPARHLISVTFGFLRFNGPDNGKFRLNTYVVAPDGIDAAGDSVVSGSETQYVSDEVMLPPALLADYTGAGLKLSHAQLYAFAR